MALKIETCVGGFRITSPGDSVRNVDAIAGSTGEIMQAVEHYYDDSHTFYDDAARCPICRQIAAAQTKGKQ